MAVFPESLIIGHGVKFTPQHKTLITDFESGKEQRRKRWAFPRRKVYLPPNVLKLSEIKDLWQFYQQQSGAFNSFTFFLPGARNFYGELVATADGSTIFDVAGKDVDSGQLTVYVAGVETSVTFLSGGGVDGVDRIQFSSAPDSGSIITADFFGTLKMTGRFEVDDLPDETVAYQLFKTGIYILEVR